MVFLLLTRTHRSVKGSQRPPDIKVWKKGHKGSDPSNPDRLCTLVAEAQLVSF
jgi:hypothetical protein